MYFRVVVGFRRRHRRLAIVVVVVSEDFRVATYAVVRRSWFVDVRITLRSVAVKAIDRLITAQL